MAGPAPVIREDPDQACFTGPRTGSAGDGPILFHGPAPQCSLYIPNRRSRPFSRHAPPSIPTARRAMPACSAKLTKRATWSCAGPSPIRWPRVESVEFRCCSSTTSPSRLASGWNCARISAACSRAGGSFLKWRAGDRWPLYRLPCIQSAHRSENAHRRLHAVDLWEIFIVTFPLLAGARVRAVKHATSKAKLSCARTRAEREWVKTTAAPRRP
jgi:hypothetical protein